MMEVEAIDVRLEKLERKIFTHEADPALPAVVLIGGIHGNEGSGVIALKQVFDEIQEQQLELKGSVYVFNGNIPALADDQRFLTVDLNRVWTSDMVEDVKSGRSSAVEFGQEQEQFTEILEIIDYILNRFDHTVVFSDLHTTSSPSCPFIPINDTIANRELAEKFPLPTVLGIEEFIDGPLLSYINEIGHVALGFEGGQHDDPNAVHIHKSFVWLLLHYSGVLDSLSPEFLKEQEDNLQRASQGLSGFYEVLMKHTIQDNEEFRMLPGFSTFQKLHKGQELAVSNGVKVTAAKDGRIFMPLYQEQGEDGFYIIRDVNRFWLWLSAIVRNIRLEQLLLLMPGIKRHPDRPHTITANLRVTKVLTRDFFHLLGYRVKKKEEDLLVMTRREVDKLKHIS
jgi:hypothetical protein